MMHLTALRIIEKGGDHECNGSVDIVGEASAQKPILKAIFAVDQISIIKLVQHAEALEEQPTQPSLEVQNVQDVPGQAKSLLVDKSQVKVAKTHFATFLFGDELIVESLSWVVAG